MDDKQRHIELARATGSWSSWVVGPWFTNRMMSIKTPEPFSQERVLEFYCSCPDQEYPDAAHKASNDLPCSFLDYYGRREQGIRKALAWLLPRVEAATPTVHRIEGDRVFYEEYGLDVFRVMYPDDTWAAFQARYVDAANRVARTDRWELRPAVNRDGLGTDLLIGLHDGEIVAMLMPLTLEGSRVPPVLRPYGYSSRDNLATPVLAS